MLATAKKIHTFNRDANDTVHQIKVLYHFINLVLSHIVIQEKEKGLLGDDYGKDLASVQSLQKKHEGFEVTIKFNI